MKASITTYRTVYLLFILSCLAGNAQAAGLIRQRVAKVASKLALVKKVAQPFIQFRKTEFYQDYHWFIKGAGLLATGGAGKVLYDKALEYRKGRKSRQARALVKAAANGNLKKVRKLFIQLQERDSEDYHDYIDNYGYGYKALISASEYGHHLVVRELMQAKITIKKDSYSYSYEKSPLIEAARGGHALAVQELIKAGFDIYELFKGETATSVAIAGDHFLVLKELVKAGLSKEHYCKKDVLIKAAKKNLFDIVEEILQYGVIVNKQDLAQLPQRQQDKLWAQISALSKKIKAESEKFFNSVDVQDADGNTALILAVEKNDNALVEALIRAGANLDIKNKRGNCAILLATRQQNLIIVQLLLDAGANVNARGPEGDCALLLATEDQNVRILQMLLTAKIDINAQNRQGDTALMLAIAKNNIEMVQALVHAGAHLNTRNNQGNCALLLAVEAQDPEILQILLAAGIDAQAKNNTTGETALILAARYNSLQKVKALIRAGVPVSTTSLHSGDDALMWAVFNKAHDVVLELIKAKAYLDTRNSTGNTPLLLAVKNNTPHIVQTLIDAGANMQVKDPHGHSLLLLATKANNSAMVNLLIAAEKKKYLDELLAAAATAPSHASIMKIIAEYAA
jgi:ankyrin repeat protein